MLSRSTLTLAAAALIAGGGYLVYDSVVVPRQETAEAEAKDLFAFEEDEIQSFQLVTEQATFEFTRSPETDPATDPETDAESSAGTGSDPDPTASAAPEVASPGAASPAVSGMDPSATGTDEAGTDAAGTDADLASGPDSSGPDSATAPTRPPAEWQIVQPLPGPANDASIAFLLNLIATGASSKSFTIAADRAAEFGLATPYATVTVTLKDGSTHRLILGNPDFDRTSLYAQVESPVTAPDAATTPAGSRDLTLRLVPMSFEQAVSRPLDDWQQTIDLDIDNVQGLDDIVLPEMGEPLPDPAELLEAPETP
ncbi:MAG: DUF4340 domain-containing protein [Prochlorothrix sp.]|nr:DUF4340 domain-containing protein [Prochlorothrix sp.]